MYFKDMGKRIRVWRYYPSGALVTGIQTSIQLGATSADVQTHKFLGKELDRMHGLDWFDLEARRYDAKVASFTSVDPLCEKYYHISPYSYCAGNPVRYVDPDGRKPRVYIETQGLGHTFVTIGEGKETVVYSYGRYGRLGSLGSVLGSLTSTGEGVLLRKTGGDACKYFETESNKKGIAIFEIENAEDQKVASFFDELWNNGIKSTSSKPAAKKGKVIDQYNLFYNNCTTKTIQAVNGSCEKELILYQNEMVYDVVGGLPCKSEKSIIAPQTLKMVLDGISRNSGDINKNNDPKGFIQDLLESLRRQ